jgi:hypothetical protein
MLDSLGGHTGSDLVEHARKKKCLTEGLTKLIATNAGWQKQVGTILQQSVDLSPITQTSTKSPPSDANLFMLAVYKVGPWVA